MVAPPGLRLVARIICIELVVSINLCNLLFVLVSGNLNWLSVGGRWADDGLSSIGDPLIGEGWRLALTGSSFLYYCIEYNRASFPPLSEVAGRVLL